MGGGMVDIARGIARGCSSILAALLTRIVFAAHCLVAFIRIMTTITWEHYYWALLAGLLCLFIETIVTLKIRKGQEYKWFCPSVFFYLATIVPCVWILELNMLEERMSAKDAFTKGLNYTPEVVQNQFPGIKNFTLFDKMQIPLEIEPAQWVVLIEQLLLFFLILGRWMLPKGDISRDELSQLLLVYIGMAADIIEFFEAFKEEQVKYNRILIIVILAIWSASLFQFTLVLTASKSTKSRAGFSGVDGKEGEVKEVPRQEKDACLECCCDCCTTCCGGCCGTEVLGILTTMILQDGPFLTLRLLLLFRYDVNSYMHIFFTVKNSLVLLLMFYRLYVVFDSTRKEKESPHDKDDYLSLDDTPNHKSETTPIKPQM